MHSPGIHAGKVISKKIIPSSYETWNNFMYITHKSINYAHVACGLRKGPNVFTKINLRWFYFICRDALFGRELKHLVVKYIAPKKVILASNKPDFILSY